MQGVRKKVPLLIEFLLRIQFKEVFFTDTLYFIFFVCTHSTFTMLFL